MDEERKRNIALLSKFKNDGRNGLTIEDGFNYLGFTICMNNNGGYFVTKSSMAKWSESPLFTKEEIKDIITIFKSGKLIYSPKEIEKINQDHIKLFNEEMELIKNWRPPSKKKSKFPGFIYFVKSKNKIKIGKTKRIKTRIKTISSEIPYKLELFHYIKVYDMTLAERLLHEYFSSSRISEKREWFKLNSFVIDQIKNNKFPISVLNLIEE